MLTDLQQDSKAPASSFADHDLERLSRVLIDRSIDGGRDHVEISFEDGWATVTGEVASTRRKCDVERHVRSLAGVRGLTSRIEITTPVRVAAWPLYGD
jgi:osmotically-inducible protein OsmY